MSEIDRQIPGALRKNTTGPLDPAESKQDEKD